MSKFKFTAMFLVPAGQLRDVVLGSEQTAFLGTPPGEANLVDGSDLERGHLQRDLEDGGRTAAVVLDTRPLDDGVEMRADHNDAIAAAAGRIGDDVLRLANLGRRRDGNPRDDIRSGEVYADLEGGADDWNGDAGTAERSIDCLG